MAADVAGQDEHGGCCNTILPCQRIGERAAVAPIAAVRIGGEPQERGWRVHLGARADVLNVRRWAAHSSCPRSADLYSVLPVSVHTSSRVQCRSPPLIQANAGTWIGRRWREMAAAAYTGC